MGRMRQQETVRSYVSTGAAPSAYFTELTYTKGIFYAVAVAYVLAVCIVVSLEPFMEHECDEKFTVSFPNPSFNENPCRHTRMAKLLFMTPDECSFGRQLVASAIFGGIIGWERRQADRPAGIRTMSLVSLGACLFTIDSTFAFLDGPMTWDASRISAAIPSGVGFLGAGLIFKESEHDPITGEKTNVVHGLTTATSVWLSAAVGVACGGGLYFAALFGIAIALVMLRFGPRANDEEEEDFEADMGHIGEQINKYSSTELSESVSDKTTRFDPDLEKGESEEKASLLSVRQMSTRRALSIRPRRQLDTSI